MQKVREAEGESPATFVSLQAVTHVCTIVHSESKQFINI